jgi:hypothetical protein
MERPVRPCALRHVTTKTARMRFIGWPGSRSSATMEHAISFALCCAGSCGNGGSVRLLICPYCGIPRRGLYGWELGGHYTSIVTRSTWGCRKCNLLRYASEGGALLIRPRGTLPSYSELVTRRARSPGSLTSSPQQKRRQKLVFCELLSVSCPVSSRCTGGSVW